MNREWKLVDETGQWITHSLNEDVIAILRPNQNGWAFSVTAPDNQRYAGQFIGHTLEESKEEAEQLLRDIGWKTVPIITP